MAERDDADEVAADADVLVRVVARTVFTRVKQGDIVAETVARLGQAIGMGLLRPGDRLPPETRLAEDLGISPVSLRSALTMLRGAGLLETHRGRGGGTFVTAAAGSATRPIATPMPSEAELRDLVDVRAVVEGGAAALAATRATAEQLDHLARLADAMEQISDFATWSERDTLFHLIVADASGSPRLTSEIGRLRAEVHAISQRIPVPRPAVTLADREHRELLRALRARRPDAARRVMERHVASTMALWLGFGRVAPGAG